MCDHCTCMAGLGEACSHSYTGQIPFHPIFHLHMYITTPCGEITIKNLIVLLCACIVVPGLCTCLHD